MVLLRVFLFPEPLRTESLDSDVDKELTLKAKIKAKDLTFKNKVKDLTFKAKAKDF